MLTHKILQDARHQARELNRLIRGTSDVSQCIFKCCEEIEFIERSYIAQDGSRKLVRKETLLVAKFIVCDHSDQIEITKDMVYAIRDYMLKVLEGYVREADYYIDRLTPSCQKE